MEVQCIAACSALLSCSRRAVDSSALALIQSCVSRFVLQNGRGKGVMNGLQGKGSEKTTGSSENGTKDGIKTVALGGHV